MAARLSISLPRSILMRFAYWHNLGRNSSTDMTVAGFEWSYDQVIYYDSLVVGGHFYTSAHLPSTLEGFNLLEQKQGISNESLEDSHYETLAEIFSSYDKVATPEEVKRVWVTCDLFLGLF
ncbi:unnamed protein product [Aspergillus oryzae RIB40]|uniref:DNA, SC010 n=1 Tax=Aspergillus oryzae (strain ATCC 42149 / RIB 40) TaxID=510516 RepID=Q2TX85_ASPOR|nr:unnamed protein product [Aspergillus oryzae RIB40]BAE66138.1 unnamed protein product [Aspergillus oryzae RIB40]